VGTLACAGGGTALQGRKIESSNITQDNGERCCINCTFQFLKCDVREEVLEFERSWLTGIPEEKQDDPQ
jgi:hypothetical protein